MTTNSLRFLVPFFALLAGCTELAEVDDPRLVTGGARGQCVGTVVPCASRRAPACGLACTEDYIADCVGTPPACSTAHTIESCILDLWGCDWDNSANVCSGASECFGSYSTCTDVQGCEYVTPCRGTALPCAGLGESRCGENSGCTWMEPDAGM